MGYVKKIWVFLLVMALSLSLAAPSFAGKWFSLLPQDDQTIPFSSYETEESADDLEMSATLSISDWSDEPERIPLTMTFLGKDGELITDISDEDKRGYEEVFFYASQAMYQMTQGQHALGNVRIFLGGQNKMHSDIWWTRTTEENVKLGDWYRASAHGLGHANQPIWMYDVGFPEKVTECDGTEIAKKEEGRKRTRFPDGEFQRLGGTLAHELGHNMYGLWDEYPYVCKDHQVLVEKSIMGDGHHCAVDVTNDENHEDHLAHWKYLNFSIPYREPVGDWVDTEKTEHHELMNESGWETLVREPRGKIMARLYSPGDWNPPRLKWVYLKDSDRILPSLGTFAGKGIQRNFFPELALGMSGKDVPWNMLESPLYLYEPNVIWMTGDNIFQIVIDRSGSMSTTMMNNAKQAAKLLVDIAELGETKIGVISFAGDVRVDYPLTLIDNEDTRADIKSTIDAIRAGGMTAIGDAAYEALQGLLDLNRPDAVKSVFLLTDGVNNRGINPDSVIPLYQEAQIPLFTFSYGAHADFNLMYRMAFLTGGETFRTPTTYAEISRAFESAFRLVNQSQGIGLGAANVQVGETEVKEFYVDSSIGNLTVSVRVSEMPADASVTLFSPSGSILEPYSEGYQEVSWYYYKIDEPEEGTWRLEVSADASRDVFFDYEVSGTHKSTPITMNVATSKVTNPFYYPEPVFLVATLSRELPITGANVQAVITYPDGSSYLLPMHDELGDGTYAALLPYTESGTYEVEVNAYDFEGEAMLTATGLQHAPDIDGAVAPPDPRPLGVHFQRTGSINVKVEGVQDDDHGNYPWEATAIFADNDGVEGRIDYAGDVDVFSFIAPEGESKLIARLFPIGEWDVAYRVLDSDGTTQLAGGTVNQLNLSVNGYYYVEFNVVEGWEYYLSVEADQGSAMGVHYAVSVGTPAPFDIPLADLVTFQTLLDDIMDGFDSGLISPYGVANALMATVQAAQRAYERDQSDVSWNQLSAFIYQLEALGDRQVDDQLAQKLIADAEYLRGTF